jgi:hypothetical protein
MLLGWFIFWTGSMSARADGGSVCLSQKTGNYQITVFSSPSPFRAGPVDISVLVQDAVTGKPLTGTRVTVCMSKPGHAALECPATHEAATNKLLYAAQFELPVPGHWELKVHIEGLAEPAEVGCELEASTPLPRWRELWPWIGWPALAVALFGIHHLLMRRRECS